jgi:hypothetical protein
MFKKYTEKDFMKLANKEIRDNNKKGGTTGKFSYLSHYIKIDDDDCGSYYPMLIVKMKRVYGKNRKITETVYTETYI